MTKAVLQKIFNRVTKHLNKQAEPAMAWYKPQWAVSPERGCAYRGEGGKTCAVGCLISDREYTPTIEGSTISEENVQKAVKRSLRVKWSYDLRLMLSQLQSAHDCMQHHKDEERLSMLNRQFETIAKQHNLDMPNVKVA